MLTEGALNSSATQCKVRRLDCIQSIKDKDEVLREIYVAARFVPF